MKGKLSITVGIPGCGKSTWLDAEPLCLTDGFVILCPDDFRKDITGQDYYPPAEDFVWAQVKTTARVLARRGYHVVIDATALSKWSRAQWVKIANDLEVDITVYVFDTPISICKIRNASRDRKVPEDVIDRMYAQFQRPDETEGFAQISKIRTWE